VLPILYSFRRCPYAMRARLALAISATPVELREVKLSAKPDAMLAASPKGTVPVLILTDGTIIDESIAIMRWTLAGDDPHGWLHHDDPALIAANDGRFKYDLDRYKYPERHGTDKDAHRAGGLAFLLELEARLASAAYLCGDRPGIADAAIMPFVRQYASVDPHWFAGQPLARLHLWLSTYLASDLFDSIMVRLPPWSPTDKPVPIDWMNPPPLR
jgi:glutathione S-transferase